MVQPAPESGDRVPPTLRRASSNPTMLNALLRERHLQNYAMFKRAYQKAARGLDKDLVETHPSRATLFRWMVGQVKDLPHPGHCTVLEAMFPGYSTRRLFEITEPPEPPSPGKPDRAVRDGTPEVPGHSELVVPTGAPDSAALTALIALALPEHVTMGLLQHLEALTSSLATPPERDRAYHQLVQLLRRWAHTMDRRDALQFLYRAAIAASAAATLDGEGYERVVSVLSGASRVDAQTIEDIEVILWRCRRQDKTLGPHAALDTVLAQRQLARSLLPHCPSLLQPRLLSVLSESSRQAGWLSFDLNQFDDAGYYYEDARSLAHEAQNVEQGAFVLCEMSHLATWRGMPRTGIDHAVAAGQWASRSGDSRLRAYTFDVAARAYAADGQRDACLTALDAAHAALPAAGDEPAESVLFSEEYDEAQHVGIRGLCHLELHDGQRAADYAQRSLKELDRSFVRDTAIVTVHLGMAYVQCEEIDEAARLLGDAGEIAVGNSSSRLTERLQQAREQLQPWHGTQAVRELDDRFTTYGLA